MTNLKRIKYFDGQLLTEEDFEAQQQYHRLMQLQHNKHFYTWGVVGGLKVNKISDTKIEIEPGVALDQEGREIILAKKKEVILESPSPNKKYVVTITYKEQEKKDKEGNVHRIIEDCSIEAKTVTDFPKNINYGISIVLAKIELNADGKIQDNLHLSDVIKVVSKISSGVKVHLGEIDLEGIVKPPQGTTTDDWDIFVAVKEIDILSEKRDDRKIAHMMGAVPPYKFSIETETSKINNEWHIICIQKGFKGNENFKTTGKVSYILLRKS